MIFSFVVSNEFLYGRILVLCRESGYIVAALQSIFTSDFSQFRAFPAVGAHHGNGNTDFTSLFNNLGNFFIVTRNINCFRIGCFNLGQRSLEVNVLGQESFLSNNLAALAFQGLLEYRSQAFGIIAGGVEQNSYVLNLQGVASKGCHYLALERVDEASTEHEFSYLAIVNGNARCSCRRRNVRNLVSSGNGSTCCYAAAGCRTNNSNNLILGYELSNGVTGFRRLRFVIAFDNFNLFAIDTGLVSFVSSHFETGQNGFTIVSNVTGQFEGCANLNGVASVSSFLFFSAATAQYGCEYHCSKCSSGDFFPFFHFDFSFSLVNTASLGAGLRSIAYPNNLWYSL